MKTLLKKSFPFHAGPKAEGYLLSASDLWNTPLSLWGLSRVSIGAVSSYVISFDFSQKLDYSEIRRKVVLCILRNMGLETRESNRLVQYMEDHEALWLDLANQVLNHSGETTEA